MQRYQVVMRMPTEVVLKVEAENEEEAERIVREGEYTISYKEFNQQILDNLEESNAEITVEEIK